MGLEEWQARIEDTLAAHFKQPEGPSRPGIDFKLSLRRGADEYRFLVRAYLAPDLTAAARKDGYYLGHTVIRYIFDRLAQGWEPTGEDYPLPALTILNPSPDYVPPEPPKRSLLARLFGR